MITGIEILKFGVEDRQAANKFLHDFGLTKVDSDIPRSDLYETMDGSRVYLFEVDDDQLPPPVEKGSTLREIVWGVKRVSDLETIASNLYNVSGFARTPDSVRAIDPNGLTIVFKLSITREPTNLNIPGINHYGNIQRVNQPSPVYKKSEPITIGHVVFFTPDLKTTQDFYMKKLGFQLSDAYKNRGAFLRCSKSGYHHDLFLLSIPNKSAGLNHVAFVVRDIHEVIGGGLHMNRSKWSTFIGPGRHPISSAYFWYVNSPLGGAFEYYTNDDYLTEEWIPRIEEHSLELFTEWAIEGGLDDNTRRQVKAL